MNRQMTTMDWLIVMVILWIPLINIVFLIYWACQSEENCKFVTRKRFAKALLIVIAIALVLLAILMLFIGAMAAIGSAVQV